MTTRRLACWIPVLALGLIPSATRAMASGPEAGRPVAFQEAGTRHAATQLAALLKSRPRLAERLETRPAVQAWILERLRVTHPPIHWDPASPVSGRAAELDARDPTRTLLRIDGGPSGIDQLTHLLFELHNVQGYADFDTIHEQAVRGEITRDEYATRMLEREFEALLAARAFYETHLSELSRAEEREARSYWRLRHGTDSFEEHVAEQRKRGHDLLDHYRALYDSLVIPERKERRTSGELPD